MSLISDEIKAVPRPAHTEVRLLGKKYYVVPYTSVRVKNKKNPIKKTYPYCGFIVYDETMQMYKYIERSLRVLNNEPSIKRYGDVAFIDVLCKDLYAELVEYFGEKDGSKIYVYSMLRLLYGDTNKTIGDEYQDSYISEMYPNIPASKNTVYDFISLLGKHYTKMQDFLLSRKKNHKVLIFDGTAITYEADNSYSEYGRNAKKSIKKQVMEIKVYDTETKEPVYFETVPGNVIDKTAFLQILERFDPNESIIIVDKGFNSEENINFLFNQKTYNFIVPYNDNSKIIREIMKNNVYDKMFSSNGHSIYGLKKEIENKFYYLYKNIITGAYQEANFMANVINKKKVYTDAKLKSKSDIFGTIAFISNLNVDESIIYDYYMMRWEIEVDVKLEKNTIDANVVRMHSDKGLLGIRSLMQISLIMLSRMYYKLKELNMLKTESIRETLKNLGKTYKHFKNGKWILSVLPKKKLQLLAKLNIIV